MPIYDGSKPFEYLLEIISPSDVVRRFLKKIDVI